MARLKNAAGTIINVSEEKADRMGSAWTRLDGKPVTAKAAPETAPPVTPTTPDEPEGETPTEPNADWKVKELRAYAETKGLELPASLTKPEILAAIADAATESEGDTPDGEAGDPPAED